MLSAPTYNRVYRFSAWYDLIITWPFALAMTLALFWTSVLGPINAFFGFQPLPELDAHAVLFANFYGSIVVIWSIVRLYLNDPRLGVFDGIGRFLFSLAMINALASGVTPLLWGFLVPEIAFGLVQILGKPGIFVTKQNP